MQALLNASQNEDEFVKEFLITHEKVSQLQYINFMCFPIVHVLMYLFVLIFFNWFNSFC